MSCNKESLADSFGTIRLKQVISNAGQAAIFQPVFVFPLPVGVAMEMSINLVEGYSK